MKDNELINRFNERDEIALKLVFYALYQRLVHWSFNMLHDYAECEDVVTISFLKMWRSNKQFYDFDQIKSFIYLIVKRRCINSIESKRRFVIKNTKADWFVGNNIDDSNKKIDRIYELIERLPGHYKMVLSYSLKGYTNKEISILENIPVNTIAIQKNRAIKLLKSLLNK